MGGERALKFHVTHARVGCYSMKVLFTHKSIRSSVSLAQRCLFKRSMGTWKHLNLERRIHSQSTVLSPLGLKGLCRVVGATIRDLYEPDKLRSDH